MARTPEEQRKYLELRMSAIGYQFAVSIALTTYIGHLVDKYFETEPWGLVIGVLLGATAAYVDLYKLSKQYKELEPPT